MQTSSRRILMLLENSAYPEDWRVRREAETLAQAGYQVSVIAPNDSHQRWREVIEGVRVYRYPPSPQITGAIGYLVEYGYAMVVIFLLSAQILLTRGSDVIHAHCPPDTFVFIGAFYKLLGKRYVYDHHDLAPEMYRAIFQERSIGIVYRILSSLEKFSCRLADHVVTTNESYRTVEMERDQVPAERITVVRNGPEVDAMPPSPPLPELRATGKTIIGYMGVIGFQDGVDHLLRALRHLRDWRDDFLAVIVGDGEALPSLRALADELHLDGSIRFAGWVDRSQLDPFMSAMDICAAPEPSNPYTDRSTMMKMMDYMLWAKPIVAFDLPEHRHSAGDAALYAQPNDDRAFAEALSQLIDDPARRQRMAEAGRVRIKERLAWRHSAPQLLKAYRKVFGEDSETSPAAEAQRSGLFRKAQRLAYWFARRNPRYIALRMLSLVKRYGLTPVKAQKRVLECVELLAQYHLAPTFPTPGRVVAENAAFCRELQMRGVELAVHGYDHVDFTGLAPKEARQQFERAGGAFESANIQFAGFRCPYLSYSDSLLDSLPPGVFRYSSNKAIVWNVIPPEAMEQATAVFEELAQFYHAEPAAVRVAVPRRVRDLVEIPASLPDDIQINDGLGLGAEGIRRVWMDVFEQVYQRGELFTILFHPELYEHCALAFESILQQARQRQPAVWVTQLREVGDWWQEKAASFARVAQGVLQFDCSPRATILLRGMETEMPTHRWDEIYRVLESRTLPLRNEHLPLLGIADDVPAETCAFLSEQGYLLATGDQARHCAVYLDREKVSDLSQVRLIECIEAFSGPLARFWRWPDEKKSALCVTGDLDTVSLLDYAARLFRI